MELKNLKKYTRPSLLGLTWEKDGSDVRLIKTV